MVWDLENLPWIAVMCKGVFPSLLWKRKKCPCLLTASNSHKISARQILAVTSQHDMASFSKELLLITLLPVSDNSVLPTHGYAFAIITLKRMMTAHNFSNKPMSNSSPAQV